jgi:hypothetical protein
MSAYKTLANRVANKFKTIACVEAIALGGSTTISVTDQNSDIDLYIFTKKTIPLHKRQKIVQDLGARKYDLNLTYWDLGDEWIDLDTGIEIDVIYWDPVWIKEQIDTVLKNHQAALGYTTCHWRTLLEALVLYDRVGWMKQFKHEISQPYPRALIEAIVQKNYPVLKVVIPSYYNQLDKALQRRDIVSVNHRLSAFLASYFDIIFAVNEVLHPGEKRILDRILIECQIIPPNLERNITDVLRLAGLCDVTLLQKLDDLVQQLDVMLADLELEK